MEFPSLSVAVYTFGGILLSSLISLGGMVLFSIRKGLIEKLMLYLISFSTGAILGDVFLHMMPEMVHEESFEPNGWYLILGGIIASFILEKFIHWHHCHYIQCEDHYHPVGTMNLVGDTVHNVTDGILIAASFLVDVRIGVATTIAVILHEVPQEISDYALLIYSGYSKGKALFFNFLTTLSALIGAGLMLWFHEAVPGLTAIILPLTAGNFLYLAGSDLIPELHKETTTSRSAVQLFWMIVGIAFMSALLLLETDAVHAH